MYLVVYFTGTRRCALIIVACGCSTQKYPWRRLSEIAKTIGYDGDTHLILIIHYHAMFYYQ